MVSADYPTQFVKLLPALLSKVERKIQQPHLTSAVNTRANTPAPDNSAVQADEHHANIFDGLPGGLQPSDNQTGLEKFGPWLFGDGSVFFTDAMAGDIQIQQLDGLPENWLGSANS